MKLQFIGTGSAFTVGGNYHSNMLFEADNGKKLLIDCGSDARHALYELGMTQNDIDAVYISHLHADHIGGLEWLAFTTMFSPRGARKMPLICHKSLLKPLWNALSGGLCSLEDQDSGLETYFELQPISEEGCFTWQNVPFSIFQTVHQISNKIVQPSYGLETVVNRKKVLLTTDTKFPHAVDDSLRKKYETADIIFHDCETSPIKSSVHAHYNELSTLPWEIRKKMWLYHYQPGPLPDAIQDGFLGFIKKGQAFEL